MSDTLSKLPPISADQRRVAAESYQRAVQAAASSNYDYAISLFMTCCKIDPSVLMYRQGLRKAQKAKYNNDLKGSAMAFITTTGDKTRLKSAKMSGKHLEVLEIGEKILCANPWDLGTQMDMAESAEQLGLSDLAVYILDQARQKHAKDVSLNRALASLFERRGDFTRAGVLWRLVQEADPRDIEASRKSKDLAASETIVRGKYEVNAAKDTGSDDNPASPISEAHAQPPASSGTMSRPTAKSGVTARPATPDKLPERAEREVAAFRAKIEADPTEPANYLRLADVYARFGRPQDARAVLEKGLAPSGQDFRIAIQLQELDLLPLRQNLAITEERIKKLQEEGERDDYTGPGVADLTRIRGKLIREIQARELELYRVKCERSPNDALTRIEFGARLRESGKIDEAIQELQQARKDIRHAWRALLNLGLCFKARGNWRLAQRNLEEAKASIPANEEEAHKEILYHLAVGYSEAGERERAIELGEELANLDYGYKGIGKQLEGWQSGD